MFYCCQVADDYARKKLINVSKGVKILWKSNINIMETLKFINNLINVISYQSQML